MNSLWSDVSRDEALPVVASSRLMSFLQGCYVGLCRRNGLRQSTLDLGSEECLSLRTEAQPGLDLRARVLREASEAT
jgi:hypothetical protein